MTTDDNITPRSGHKDYVWFDWAVKHILRDKANFAILEGFISVMIGQEMHIIELLESEGNQDTPYSKFNRVDIKARNHRGETVIIEVQNIREMDFLERMLFGAASAVTEQVSLGRHYGDIRKVYTISIVYFGLGEGEDYLYHGQTVLKGVHTHDQLRINRKERDALVSCSPEDIFPEYYLVRVKKFKYNSLATAPIEQWMNYLKTGIIGPNDTAPGLEEARQKLLYDAMDKAGQKAYRDHLLDIRTQQEAIDDSRAEGYGEGFDHGFEKGKEKGIEKGREAERMDMAKAMLASGMSPAEVCRIARIPLEKLPKA
ncbi:MAG: PD-(D/E)XK nuclease family transposase [Bacteroidales bacterium]|nr:PD-(D/E)XK nuclease family transposase [Bacteroidales bacterium]